MKISVAWLREWVNPPVDNKTLIQQLTMSGLEVEGIFPVAGEFSKVTIGFIRTAERHPNADRLQVCTVDVGEKDLLTIVCGAPNARPNLKVAVARVGAQLPNNLVIKETKLRGVLSQGMICSAGELGFAETSDGIIELPGSAEIGKDLREWLQLNDEIIEISVTPNRGDCLSLLGIAREVGVINHCPLKTQEKISIDVDKNIPSPQVQVIAKNECPHYVGRVLKNIDNKVETPIWMIERLRRSGIRHISPVVDVMNYVMLEIGQPLHAFDLTKISGSIIVRQSKSGETVQILDGQTLTLDSQTLTISDDKHVLALAGVMGGLDSAVGIETKDLFIESAFFNPLAISGRARQYNLATDSAFRFERGVDPILQIKGIERATQLLQEIVGGRAGPLIIHQNEDALPKRRTISLSQTSIRRMLGIDIPKTEIERILIALGFEVSAQSEGWSITVPSFRFDLQIEEDLIEEIARIYGYDKIPAQPVVSNRKLSSETHIPLSRIRNLLVDRGYQEAITYSFVDPKIQNILEPDEKSIPLINPISPELSVMRTTLWSGLINALLYNFNRQQLRIRLFETGLRFRVRGEAFLQEKVLSGVLAGHCMPEQWGETTRNIDFFDVKGDIEALCALSKNSQFRFVKTEHAALHPGQSSQILFNDKPVGIFGKIHPNAAQLLDVKIPVYLFEINLDCITEATVPLYRSISKFPQIRRDIAFFVDENVTAEQVIQCIKNTASNWLIDVQIFDVYQGKGVTSGEKSVAFSLILQDPSRTLVDAEVNSEIEKVVASLQKTFNIKLRE